jgi:hypothetical protein
MGDLIFGNLWQIIFVFGIFCAIIWFLGSDKTLEIRDNHVTERSESDVLDIVDAVLLANLDTKEYSYVMEEILISIEQFRSERT